MTRSARYCAILVLVLGELGCSPRRPAAVRGIELEDPEDEARRAAQQSATPPDPGSGLVESATQRSAASGQNDREFVYSRVPMTEREREVAQIPIHINQRWWPFRARHLGVSETQAVQRDAQLSKERAPAGFWDTQTAVEAVSVWTVLCNECHGGRRQLADALEMPPPARGWGAGEGLFFGNRRTYRQMFNTVYGGGPVRPEIGRAEMPAWRNILSTEMIWALLYFLEYQSGGIESRFPPSLYPRRPKLLGGSAE